MDATRVGRDGAAIDRFSIDPDGRAPPNALSIINSSNNAWPIRSTTNPQGRGLQSSQSKQGQPAQGKALASQPPIHGPVAAAAGYT